MGRNHLIVLVRKEVRGDMEVLQLLQEVEVEVEVE
jgi:hypothetical protein